MWENSEKRSSPLRSIRYRKPPATSALMIGANRYSRVRKNRNYEFEIKPPGRRIDTETRRTNNILLSRHKRRVIRSFRAHVRSGLSPKKKKKKKMFSVTSVRANGRPCRRSKSLRKMFDHDER